MLLLGWLGYRFVRSAPESVTALVPPDAQLILESRDLQQAQSTAGTMSLQQLPLFNVALSRLQRLLGAVADSNSRSTFLASKAVQYSLHPVSKNELDFIFYVPLREADGAFVTRLQQPDPNQYRTLSRSYDGQTIYELRDIRNRVRGSYLIRGGYLIGSPSGILLENLARHLRGSFGPKVDVAFPASPDNAASVYIRPDVLGGLIGDPKVTSSLLRVFIPESLTFQFRRSASPTHWLGFASDPVGNRQTVANLFAGQTPHRIRNSSLIPQQTATVYHLGISDGPRFGQAVSQLLERGGNDRLTKRLARIRPLLPDFYQLLSGDVLLCRAEATNNAMSQVVLMEARDVGQLSQQLQRIAYQLASPTERGTARPAPRPFLGHQLLPLPTDELPATLLSSLFAGFPQTWLTQHGNYVLIANSEEALQTYLLALRANSVWATDRRLAPLVSQTLRPAHLTTFTRLPRAGSTFLAQWPANWQALLGSTPFANIDNVAYQATYGQEHVLSTLVLGRGTGRSDTSVLNRLLLRKRIPFNASLVATPVVVGRLSDPAAQIWAQNSARQFVLLTTEKDKIVQDTTDGAIQSNVVAVDWRNNGQLQYAFMTRRSLYLADLGNKRVRLQRVPLPDGIETAYLAQPKGSSRQPDLVALLAHRSGAVYALDRKQQRVVRLFTPQQPAPLLLPFQVLDQNRRLEIVGLQQNTLLNRWVIQPGSPLGQAPHFPLRVKVAVDSLRFAGPCLWLAAGRQIAAISQAGVLIRLTEAGQIVSQKQLYRPLRGGQFRLFPDAEQTGYLILRTTDADVAVLDADGNRLFELRNLSPEQTHVQYHRLGVGVEILAVKSGNFTTLYDRSGQRIGDRPIPSDFPVTLQFDDQTSELYIVSSIQKAVQLFSIRIQ